MTRDTAIKNTLNKNPGAFNTKIEVLGNMMKSSKTETKK
jgi:hypothetical protein